MQPDLVLLLESSFPDWHARVMESQVQEGQSLFSSLQLYARCFQVCSDYVSAGSPSQIAARYKAAFLP